MRVPRGTSVKWIFFRLSNCFKNGVFATMAALEGTVDAPGNRDFIVIGISGFQTFVFQNFPDGFANGNRVPVGGQGIVLQIGELDGIVRCQRMVISHNNDQFLEGDRNKRQDPACFLPWNRSRYHSYRWRLPLLPEWTFHEKY